MKKLCFTTYVYGYYQDYIPIYVFSILKSFPQHYVKIFLKESLSNNNKEALNLIKSDNFEIVENFTDLDWCEIPHAPSLRFLITREYFKEFDYVYFGDVDFIIYNEHDDDFYNIYLNHIEKTGLPFSNEWNYDWNRYRMTGLHFIIKDSYFDMMDKWIEEMKIPNGNFFRNRSNHHKGFPSYDEEMLYYMACHAFDLRSLIDYRRPFHGLHFGTFRILSKNDSFSKNLTHECDGRNNFNDWIGKDFKKLNDIIKDDVFQGMYRYLGVESKDTIDKALFNLYKKIFL